MSAGMGEGAPRARVLYVDDEPDTRRMMGDMIELLGFECVLAGDVEEGLALARARHPDVILMDVMMPGIDGYAGCRRVKADPELGSIPVIMFTSLDRMSNIERAFEAGAADYVIKPPNSDHLKAKIEKALAGKAG